MATSSCEYLYINKVSIFISVGHGTRMSICPTWLDMPIFWVEGLKEYHTYHRFLTNLMTVYSIDQGFECR